MSFLKMTSSGLVVLVLIASLAACSTASPTPAPSTDTPTIPLVTDTLAPSEPPAPTEVQPTEVVSTGGPTLPVGTLPVGTEPAAPSGSTPAAGITPVVPSTSGSGAADRYQYVGQNIADNIQVRPGTPITIVWTVKNAGTTGWTTAYLLRYYAGIKAEKDQYSFLKAVPAGQTTTLTVSIVAPTAPGNYSTWWKLTNPQLQNFGDVDFSFTVSSTPSVGTSTPSK